MYIRPAAGVGLTADKMTMLPSFASKGFLAAATLAVTTASAAYCLIMATVQSVRPPSPG